MTIKKGEYQTAEDCQNCCFIEVFAVYLFLFIGMFLVLMM